jgi:hypothetical protein
MTEHRLQDNRRAGHSANRQDISIPKVVKVVKLKYVIRFMGTSVAIPCSLPGVHYIGRWKLPGARR